jgi:hypothetical protein
MEPLQREIEDERKARLHRISQTGAGSLGCGLTTSWIDWLSAEPGPPPAEPLYIEFSESVRGTTGLITGIGRQESAERADLLRLVCDFMREWNCFGQEPTPPRQGLTQTSWQRARNEGSDTVGRSPAQRLRHREVEWRQTHTAELRRYENQWVVLEGEEIIAHDSNAAQAIRQAKSRGIRTPYIFFVEPESDNSVRIGL